MLRRTLALASPLLLLAACEPELPPDDDGGADAGWFGDGGLDASVALDASFPDAQGTDASEPLDGASVDATTPDASSVDASAPDAATVDAASVDAAAVDAATVDASVDAGGEPPSACKDDVCCLPFKQSTGISLCPGEACLDRRERVEAVSNTQARYYCSPQAPNNMGTWRLEYEPNRGEPAIGDVSLSITLDPALAGCDPSDVSNFRAAIRVVNFSMITPEASGGQRTVVSFRGAGELVKDVQAVGGRFRVLVAGVVSNASHLATIGSFCPHASIDWSSGTCTCYFEGQGQYLEVWVDMPTPTPL